MFEVHTRLLAGCIVGLALMTFVLPILSISPPVMGQAEWSALDLITVTGFLRTRCGNLFQDNSLVICETSQLA
jgi:hypothetical protein